ncbi:MAG: hypothetical protein ACYDH9_06460 [Limisphaerales bacterium]
MKEILLSICFVAQVAQVCAQGTFQFVVNLSGANEAPPKVPRRFQWN